MFFSLLFLCIFLGGNADVNIDTRRELSKLLSSEEAYDGSLVIPITKNSVGEFLDDEGEVAVGDRRRLFFGDALSKKFEVHLKARELGKDGDDSSSDDKSYGKRSDSKSGKKVAKERKDKKDVSKEKKAVKKAAKEAKKENKKAKKKLKQAKKIAKKEAKKALKKIKKELKKAKKATRSEKKKIAKKVTKKILKKINKKMKEAGGKKLRFSDLERRRRRPRRRRKRRGGCNRCKCKRSCSCDSGGDRCSCRRKCNCRKQRERSRGNQFQQMHVHIGQPSQPAGPGCPNASKCPNAPAGSPCSGPCGGSKASPCAQGYGNPNDCRKKIGNYVRTLIGEESDIFRLLKVKIQNMHMLNHIMREGMDRHLRKKIISMHDLHDLISKKMDPGKKKAATLTKILDAVENIKSQRKDYNDKLSKHFSKIKDRLQKEHKRLRKRLKKHGAGTRSGFDGVNKILDVLKKQHEGKSEKRASRLEKKMDKVLEAISDRSKQQDEDSEDAADQRAMKLQKAQAAALKEHSNKQKEYWNKLKGFLENFKAKQYGKLSKSADIAQDSESSDSDSDSAEAAYKTKNNLPYFLQQALKHHTHLATIVHLPGDSSEEDLSSGDGISLDDEAFRRQLRIDDSGLDSFMDAYGPETEVGESFWDLDDEDESFSDSSDFEYAVGSPHWDMFDVDDSDESDEMPVGESEEWEEYPLSEEDPEESEFEDSLHYLKNKADSKYDEFMVGSFDPDDMVDQFLLKQLEPQDNESEEDDSSDELQVGDWYSSDSSEDLNFDDLFLFDSDDEEALGAEMPDYLFDYDDEDSVSDSYDFDSYEDDEDEIALGDSWSESDSFESDSYDDEDEIALGDAEITLGDALELLDIFSDDSEEALGAEMSDYLFKYMDEDSSEDSSEEESSESDEESVSADMPDYLFKYMDEDDEESVSAEMPDYLFKYMDEDSSEESESDSSDEYPEDENDEAALAEYNDLYDLSEEQVGEPGSEDSSSESEEYFVMQHTVDEEEPVGNDQVVHFERAEQAVGGSEKPLSVGDSFFDISDDQLVQDLAAKFGLEDDDDKNTEAEEDSVNSDGIDLTDADAGVENNQRKTHDHEIMVGVSARGFGVKRVAFWSNSSFHLAVTICSIVLFGVFAYLIIQWYQDKGDGLDDYFEELEG